MGNGGAQHHTQRETHYNSAVQRFPWVRSEHPFEFSRLMITNNIIFSGACFDRKCFTLSDELLPSQYEEDLGGCGDVWEDMSVLDHAVILN